jgi:hypothetical protein
MRNGKYGRLWHMFCAETELERRTKLSGLHHSAGFMATEIELLYLIALVIVQGAASLLTRRSRRSRVGRLTAGEIRKGEKRCLNKRRSSTR